MRLKEGGYQYNVMCDASDIIYYDRRRPELSNAPLRI